MWPPVDPEICFVDHMWSPQNPVAKPENPQEPLDLLATLGQSCVCVNVSVLVSETWDLYCGLCCFYSSSSSLYSIIMLSRGEREMKRQYAILYTEKWEKKKKKMDNKKREKEDDWYEFEKSLGVDRDAMVNIFWHRPFKLFS